MRLAWISIAAGVVVSVLLALASLSLCVSCAEGEPVDRGTWCPMVDCEVLPAAGAPGAAGRTDK